VRAWVGWAVGLAAVALFMLVLGTSDRLPRREEKPPVAKAVEKVPPAPEPRPAPTPPEPPRPSPRPEPPPAPAPLPKVEPPAPPTPPPAPEPPPKEREPDTRPAEPPKIARPVVALLGRIQGDVKVTSPAGRRPAVAGAGIAADEGLESAGHAVVEFPDGSHVEVGPDTVLARLVDGQGRRGLELTRGTLSATVVKQPAGRAVSVTTAHAEVTVLGTQFTVAALADAARIEVREGRVLVRRLPDGASLEVTAGHVAVAAKGVKLESKPILATRDFQDGPTYSGTRDTSISGAEPARAFGAQETLEVDGDEVEGKKIYGLLKWDLSEIPPGAIVKSAVLTLTVADASLGVGYSLYEMKRAWSEAEATWRLAASGQPWSAAGARSPRDRGAEVLGTMAPRAKGELRVLLNPAAEAVLQSWIRTPGSNHGFIIANDSNTDGFKFYSRESSHLDRRPRLTITYALAPK
jgi:hypothetical protein